MRNEEYLHDVTLVGDDHTQISAHKLVLSACSEYFKEVFKRNNYSNTLMCLEGLSKQDLKNVLDYMYNGEVHIYQEGLNRFLSVAQRLKLEGLLESEDNVKAGDIMPGECEAEDNFNEISPEITELKSNIQQNTFNQINPKSTVSFNTTVMNEIDAKLMENLEPLDDGHFSCRIC